MSKVETVKNKNGANLAIGEIRNNTFSYYNGCTVDVEILIYSDDQSKMVSFWIEDFDTGFTGESWMDGYYEDELENNPDFTEDMELSDIYTDEELEERAMDDSGWLLVDSYDLEENPIFEQPILKYINRIEDAMELAACPTDGCGDRRPYTEDEWDMQRIFALSDEDKFEQMNLADVFDFEGMEHDADIEVDVYYGDERDYYGLIKDAKKTWLRKCRRRDIALNPEKWEKALEYAAGHDTKMLLLPLVVCKGLQNTHFIHRPGLRNKVYKAINRTDWASEDAVQSLYLIRTIILSELKLSRWIYFGYDRFEKYNFHCGTSGMSEKEIDDLTDVLDKLCAYTTVTIDNPFSVDKWHFRHYDGGRTWLDGEEIDEAMVILRSKYGLVMAGNVALHFVMDDDQLDDAANKDLYNYTSEDTGEDYSAGLMSSIYSDVYGTRGLENRINDIGPDGRKPIEGAYRAEDVFAKYDIDPDLLPKFWKADDEMEVEEIVKKEEKKEPVRRTPVFTATKDEDGNLTFNNLFKMIHVEGGSFLMGASGKCVEEAREDETPTHEVTLSDYYIGQTAVTVDLWLKVMGGSSKARNNQLPIGGPSWFDCHKFTRKLSELTAYEYHFSLPTEAQWEFAARGGVKSRGFKYSGSDCLDEVAWYGENSGGQRHPVARKMPNELGLYDMSGDIGEWCEDEWNDYPDCAQTDPDPEAEGGEKVFRGGSYTSDPARCRVSNRSHCKPIGKHSNIGFRLAISIPNWKK